MTLPQSSRSQTLFETLNTLKKFSIEHKYTTNFSTYLRFNFHAHVDLLRSLRLSKNGHPSSIENILEAVLFEGDFEASRILISSGIPIYVGTELESIIESNFSRQSWDSFQVALEAFSRLKQRIDSLGLPMIVQDKWVKITEQNFLRHFCVQGAERIFDLTLDFNDILEDTHNLCLDESRKYIDGLSHALLYTLDKYPKMKIVSVMWEIMQTSIKERLLHAGVDTDTILGHLRDSVTILLLIDPTAYLLDRLFTIVKVHLRLPNRWKTLNGSKAVVLAIIKAIITEVPAQTQMDTFTDQSAHMHSNQNSIKLLYPTQTRDKFLGTQSKHEANRIIFDDEPAYGGEELPAFWRPDPLEAIENPIGRAVKSARLAVILSNIFNSAEELSTTYRRDRLLPALFIALLGPTTNVDDFPKIDELAAELEILKRRFPLSSNGWVNCEVMINDCEEAIRCRPSVSNLQISKDEAMCSDLTTQRIQSRLMIDNVFETITGIENEEVLGEDSSEIAVDYSREEIKTPVWSAKDTKLSIDVDDAVSHNNNSSFSKNVKFSEIRKINKEAVSYGHVKNEFTGKDGKSTLLVTSHLFWPMEQSLNARVSKNIFEKSTHSELKLASIIPELEIAQIEFTNRHPNRLLFPRKEYSRLVLAISFDEDPSKEYDFDCSQADAEVFFHIAGLNFDCSPEMLRGSLAKISKNEENLIQDETEFSYWDYPMTQGKRKILLEELLSESDVEQVMNSLDFWMRNRVIFPEKDSDSGVIFLHLAQSYNPFPFLDARLSSPLCTDNGKNTLINSDVGVKRPEEDLALMDLVWPFIKGMLTNLGELKADRIHTMLTSFAGENYRGFPQKVLVTFLESKVRQGVLIKSSISGYSLPSHL